MKSILLIIILFIIPLFISAQVTQEWVQRYNGLGDGSNFARSMAADAAGNVYVTGTIGGGLTDNAYATVKYNSSGQEQWVQIYNGTGIGDDEAESIAVDADGNVYVTGYSVDNQNQNYYDYATIKYNSSGQVQWVQRYDGPSLEDRAKSIAVDAAGNVYVTGFSEGTGTYDDYATIKYNSSGLQLWVARYNGPLDVNLNAPSIVIDAFGNVYVSGGSNVWGTDYDYATIKYNSSGQELWVSRYNGQGNGLDIAFSLVVDATGNVYVTGLSVGNGTYFDYATIKYNSFGQEQWVARYNGPGNWIDRAESIAVDAAGNVYVTGGSCQFGISGTENYATIKYNSSGQVQWVSRYNGLGNEIDFGNSIAVDGAANVYVTGGSEYDYATIKYNSSGQEQWVQRYNGPVNQVDVAYSMVLDATGNVYVTGFSDGFSGGTFSSRDFATIKYSQQVGILQTATKIPDKYTLSQNYPNPFNPNTKIIFDIHKQGYVSLKIFDILGKEISILVNENLVPGSYEASFNGQGLTSGVYFYTLETAEFKDTKKMLMSK